MTSPDWEQHARDGGTGDQYREYGLQPPLAVKYPDLYRSETLQQVEGVPIATQLNSEFCGYASVAMLFQSQGRDLDQYDIFRHAHNTDINPRQFTKEQLPPSKTFFGLAVTAKRLVKDTDLRADFWTEEEFAKYKRLVDPEATPLTVLDKYLIEYGVPAMVRIPGHNMVGVGLDQRSPVVPGNPKIYTFNDPDGGRRRAEKADRFEFLWGNREPRVGIHGEPIPADRLHPGNTAFLMLAIRRR